ncbi:hypothetical protein WSM22_22330 [Cytophagales bacterium WSM2-2]|nr:hypothetical protein WSM22_22330 [Cytophagales bacterium WSM2-2]
MLKAAFEKYQVLILHVAFWVLYASYRIFDLQSFLGLKKAAIVVSVSVTIKAAASYLHYFFVLPVWLDQKKIGRYFFILVLLLAVMVSVGMTLETFIYHDLLPQEDYFKSIRIARIISSTWDILVFIIFIGLIRFAFDRFDLENKQKQLRNEKLTAELNYLKAQINPHFLFNTLHNLNYLVYAKSPAANDVVIKLSNMMRFMIYDANKASVALSRELDHLQDYIHLESIRLNQKFNLQFEKSGNLHGVEIAPLLLITLVENSFKHGIRDGDADCWIKMTLKVNEREITFEISNKIVTPDSTKLKSGFGLNNLRQRLDLSYPERHTLDIMISDGIYKAKLTLSL